MQPRSESENKRELPIEVEVTSASRQDFSNHFYKVIPKANNFVKTELASFDIKLSDEFFGQFTEVIANAFDSFSKHGLGIGSKFLLKIVIKEKNGSVFLNVMDNGWGFVGQPKGAKFGLNEVKFTFKTPTLGFIGGMGIGLGLVEKVTKKHDGILFFKNRQKAGATVGIEFNPLRSKI